MAGNVARMREMRYAYRILVGKPVRDVNWSIILKCTLNKSRMRFWA
jgi:hypothetical protein